MIARFNGAGKRDFSYFYVNVLTHIECGLGYDCDSYLDGIGRCS